MDRMRLWISGNTWRRRSNEDPSYCSLTVKEDQLGSAKLRSFKYFLRRISDLTQKNGGIRGKASEVERQLRDRVLEVCYQEQMAKLSRQEARAMEEERAKQQRVPRENGEERRTEKKCGRE